MVVDYFNFVCVATFPNKTDTPLVVYADAMLSFAVILQLFQSISWRNADPSVQLRHQLIKVFVGLLPGHPEEVFWRKFSHAPFVSLGN
jgi:hypothetical protein